MGRKTTNARFNVWNFITLEKSTSYRQLSPTVCCALAFLLLVNCIDAYAERKYSSQSLSFANCSTVVALNNNGEVLCKGSGVNPYSVFANGITHPIEHADFIPYDFNSLGTIVGAYRSGGNLQAAKIQNNQLIHLDGHDLGGLNSIARVVNEDENADWAGTDAAADGLEQGIVPFLDRAAPFTSLPRQATVNDINIDAIVIGKIASEENADIFHAYWYKDYDLRVIPNTWLEEGEIEALAINDAGDIVGWAEVSPGIKHAFLYRLSDEEPRLIDLHTAVGEQSIAYDINGAGMVVGTAQNSAGDYYPFIYSGGGMVDLNTHIDIGFRIPKGSANHINSNEEIIVRDNNGVEFKLLPFQEAIPLLLKEQACSFEDCFSRNGTLTDVFSDMAVVVHHQSFSVYVYTGIIWLKIADISLEEEFTSNAGITSAAVNENLIVVGAKDLNKVFMYERNGNEIRKIQTLKLDEKYVDYSFGSSVAIDSAQLVVGAPIKDGVDAPPNGLVFVYDLSDISIPLFEIEGAEPEFGNYVELEKPFLAVSGRTTQVFHLEKNNELIGTFSGNKVKISGTLLAHPYGYHVQIYEYDGSDWLHQANLPVAGYHGNKHNVLDFDLDGNVLVFITRQFYRGPTYGASKFRLTDQKWHLTGSVPIFYNFSMRGGHFVGGTIGYSKYPHFYSVIDNQKPVSLTLDIEGPDRVGVERVVSYSLSVRNSDIERGAWDVKLTALLPDGVMFEKLASSDGCQIADLQLVCRVHFLPPGETKNFKLDLKTDRVGDFETTFTASQIGLVEDEHTIQVDLQFEVVDPEISIAIDNGVIDASVNVSIDIPIVVTNTDSELAAFDFYINSFLPQGFLFNGSAPIGDCEIKDTVISCHVVELLPGAARNFTIHLLPSVKDKKAAYLKFCVGTTESHLIENENCATQQVHVTNGEPAVVINAPKEGQTLSDPEDVPLRPSFNIFNWVMQEGGRHYRWRLNSVEIGVGYSESDLNLGPLENSEYHLEIELFDPDNSSIGVVAETTFKVDLPVALVEIIEPEGGYIFTNQRDRPWSFNFGIINWPMSEEGSYFRWRLDGQDQGRGVADGFLDLPPLNNGTYQIEVELYDENNTATGIKDTVEISVDVPDPVLTIVTNHESSHIVLMPDDKVLLDFKIDQWQIAADSDRFVWYFAGEYQGEAALKKLDITDLLRQRGDGEYLVDIELIDSNGEKLGVTASAIVPVRIPRVIIEDQKDSTFSNQSGNLLSLRFAIENWDVSENQGAYRVTLDDEDQGTFDSVQPFNLIASDLSLGEHQLQIELLDINGEPIGISDKAVFHVEETGVTEVTSVGESNSPGGGGVLGYLQLVILSLLAFMSRLLCDGKRFDFTRRCEE